MSDIAVHMRNGTVRYFRHEGRPGGSYTKHVRYEGAFVVIEDEWGGTTAISAADVLEVKTTEQR
jgi:hypothetical protein